MSSPKTFFSIAPTATHGFTYQLYQWSFLHELGTVMGYAYFHVPFGSPRTEDLDHDAERPEQVDIYGFLGITQHFQKANALDIDEHTRRVEIAVDESYIWNRRAWQIARLIEHIKKAVAQHSRYDEKILVELVIKEKLPPLLSPENRKAALLLWLRMMYYAARLTVMTHSKISRGAWKYGPHLYPLYRKQRKNQPQPSSFPSEGIKVLMHIRRGDFAAIDTPWGEKIQILQTRDLPDKHISTLEYKRVAEQLAARLKPQRLAILSFSDGYASTLPRLKKNQAGDHLKREKIENLRQHLIAKDRHNVQQLEEVENSRAIIGETRESLFALIESTLTAKIIITASYYRLMRKLGLLYFDKQRSPIMIFLHRGGPDCAEFSEIPVPTDKAIFFDVRNPDYDTLEEQMKKFLPL